MLPLLDLLRHIYDLPAGNDRHALTRLVLNAVYDPAAYPIQLAELMSWPGPRRALAWGFLDWCAARPSQHTRWPDDSFAELQSLLDEETTHA